MTTIDDRVRQHAQERPDDVAIVGPSGTLRWAELDAAADRAAAFLAGRGVGPGSRVGWLGRNDLAYPALLLGTWRRRAALVGLNWRLSPAELEPVLAVADLDLLVADEASRELASAAAQPVIVSGVDFPSGDGDVVAAALAPDPDDDALIFFTSGSTGRPKGVVLTRGRNDQAGLAPTPFHLTPAATALIVPPVFHVAGSTWTQLNLAAGSTQVYVSDTTPKGLVAALAEHDVTHALLVPTLLRMVLGEVSAQGITLPRLRHVAYGSAPMPVPLLREALEVLGCGFTQVYGLTETGGAAVNLPPEAHTLSCATAHRLNSAGIPVDGVEVRVVESGSTQPCASGVHGEIQLRSEFMMRGYWRDAERTAAVLDAEGWLRTGDLGRLDDDGYLYITGRADDMIITGGENVFPGEVERVIAALPETVECAVFGVADEHWGERVFAAVVTDPPTLSADAVIEECRRHLAHYKAPTRVLIVDALPRSATGKIAKGTLLQWAAQGEGSRA